MQRLAKRILALGLTFSGFPALAHEPADPLRRPVAADFAKRWLTEQPPVRVFGNTYLVGFSGMTVGLIDTGEGLIVIDAALPQAVDSIEANIRKLGFKLKDVRWIFSTEPHYDHASGLAALARDTGATVVASPQAAEVLRHGGVDANDPQSGWLQTFPAVTRLKTLTDGQTVKLGRTTITAHATAGHTAGSMSWSWRACQGQDCRSVVFASSLNPVSTDDYRFTDPSHAAVVASYRKTFARLRQLPCDILLTPHPDQGGLDLRMAAYRAGGGFKAFIDPGACRVYVDRFEQKLNARLAKEVEPAR